MTNKQFYNRLKKQNIFWSYDSSTILSDEIIIEQTLIYADVDDIQTLFVLFNPLAIKKVWDQKIVPDFRYKKLNYYLGKLFFNIVDMNKYLQKKSKENSRYEQLKKFIA